MPVDNTYGEEQVVTKVPTGVDEQLPSAELPVLATRAPVEIGEPQFYTVTDNLSSSGSTPRNVSTSSVLFSVLLPVIVTRSSIEK